MEYAPGVHSRNSVRLLRETVLAGPPLRRLRLTLYLVGCACLTYFFYSLADQYLYQAYENWAFDQLIAGRPAPNFFEFLRAQAGLSPHAQAPARSPAIARAPSTASTLKEGDLVGRIVIARLNISAIVREGVSDSTLSKAVGHVPDTGLPGQPGNVAIAAHRDTLFRALKDIQNNDTVLLETPAVTYKYSVKATEVVKPTDVAVLKPDGGGLIAGASNATPKLLTMITCYPFRFVGSAPKRFIVEAELAADAPSAAAPVLSASSAVPLPSVGITKQPAGLRKARGFRPLSSSASKPVPASLQHNRKARKQGFWQRLLRELN